jgi:hypothetical protein
LMLPPMSEVGLRAAAGAAATNRAAAAAMRVRVARMAGIEPL